MPIGIVVFAGALKVLPRTVAHPGMKLDTVGMVPSDAPAITAWACLVPIAAAIALIFLLPMKAREQEV